MLFGSGHIDYDDGLFLINQEELSKRHIGTLGLGVSVEYRKLHAGFSINISLFVKSEVLMDNGNIKIQKEDSDNIHYTFREAQKNKIL